MRKKITLDLESNPRLEGKDKVILAFRKNKKKQPFSLFLISYYSGITTGGYLSNIVKLMLMNGELEKVDCPHCRNSNTYSLVE